MARFVDLDLEENQDDNFVQSLDRGKPLLVQNGRAMTEAGKQHSLGPVKGATVHDQREQAEPEEQEDAETKRPHAVDDAITRAFQCYPIVLGIASNIDLNTLDALARTSCGIHEGLIQYRTSLLAATLRCSNERELADQDQTLRPGARERNWNYLGDGRSLNGSSGFCARDMVAECRKCGEVICRNCTIKPPASAALRERHRRLCRTCSKAPIASLAFPPLDAALPLSSDAVQRTICQCEDQGVWLCQPCGRSIRSADHEYKRIWRWRNQYGEVIGGLGTGIGDGDRGVVCGREGACLAARDREQEIDCDAEDARGVALTPSPGSQPPSASTPSTAAAAASSSTASLTVGNAGFPFTTNGTIESLVDEIRRQRTPSPQLGPGYERHEIEGIGGVVKRKLVRMVRVGACVPEWEEERAGLPSSGKVMAREISGASRSWCGWCWRAIPGKKDIANGQNSP